GGSVSGCDRPCRGRRSENGVPVIVRRPGCIADGNWASSCPGGKSTMSHSQEQASRRGMRGGAALALVLFCALALMPLACGSDGDDNDQQALHEALRDFGPNTPIRL